MTEHERMRKQLWKDTSANYIKFNTSLAHPNDKRGHSMVNPVKEADRSLKAFDTIFPPPETTDHTELEKERDELKKALKEIWDICIEDTPWNKSVMQESSVSHLYQKLESFRDLIIDKDNT